VADRPAQAADRYSFIAISFVVSAYLRYSIGAIAVTFFKGIPSSYANLVGYTIGFPVLGRAQRDPPRGAGTAVRSEL
jgi:hypothetical protein